MEGHKRVRARARGGGRAERKERLRVRAPLPGSKMKGWGVEALSPGTVACWFESLRGVPKQGKPQMNVFFRKKKAPSPRNRR